jgi:hypothetical protein
VGNIKKLGLLLNILSKKTKTNIIENKIFPFVGFIILPIFSKIGKELFIKSFFQK